MDQNKYYKVTITYPSAAIRTAEEIELIALNDFLCGGIEEFSLNEATVDDFLGARSYSGGDIPLEVLSEVEDRVHESATPYLYYFYQNSEECEGHDAQTNARQFFVTIRENYPELETSLSEEEVQDWNQEWKKHYNPIMVSDSLEIVPSFFKESHESTAANALYIDPGMGFGTGSHETTFLCLKLFCKIEAAELLEKNPTVLDFGCGSGILGLAALKMLKPAIVDLYDIDENSLHNTQVNLELNNIKTGFSLYLPKNRDNFLTHYNLIFANILLPVLLEEYQNFKALLAPKSMIILSGVLNEQVPELLGTFLKENAFSVKEQVSKGDWSAVLLVRN